MLVLEPECKSGLQPNKSSIASRFLSYFELTHFRPPEAMGKGEQRGKRLSAFLFKG